MSLIQSFREQTITTDYVVDETLTLLRARNENQRAIAFGRSVLEGQGANVVPISDLDLAKSWEIFKKYSDKEWSFTDCTSFVVMERLGIQKAFAFDDHFRQFGTVAVVP